MRTASSSSSKREPDRRDERSYKQFRRRPRNSMTMTPDDWLDNRAGKGFLAAMVLPMFMNPGGTGFFQGGPPGARFTCRVAGGLGANVKVLP